jgi:hypothetical protein
MTAGETIAALGAPFDVPGMVNQRRFAPCYQVVLGDRPRPLLALAVPSAAPSAVHTLGAALVRGRR